MKHGLRWAALGACCPCDICREAAVLIRQRDNALRSCHGGVTVTLRHLPTGETVTVTATGETVDGSLSTIVAGLDAAEWRILAVSTVRTILADLRGRRCGTGLGEQTLPNQLLLGRVGRLDLLGGLR